VGHQIGGLQRIVEAIGAVQELTRTDEDRSMWMNRHVGEVTTALHSPTMSRIAIGADHAGFDLKQHLVVLLAGQGHDVVDCGTHSTDSVDYPPICAAVGRLVRDGQADVGVVLGGSGQGEQLAANKVRGVRAALCNDLYTARMARSHNDANVLSMGARVVGLGLAEEIVQLFLSTPFDGGRHARRVAQLAEIEADEAGEN
jgi:ribose 5-phosphate isomerase B